MMTTDEISRFFSEEDVKKAFQFPDWAHKLMRDRYGMKLHG